MTSFGFRRDGADISPLRSISEMIFSVQGISALAVFLIVSIAANQFGDLAARIKFPLISGYITAGIVAGPYLLDIVSAQDLQEILFINDIALAFIAFCAGSELYFPEIRNLFKIIMVHLTCVRLNRAFFC
jgi:Kef-type K+ transport system membrane component KefB